MKKILVVLVALLTACASPATLPAPDIVSVQFSSSTQAWIPDLYSCASELNFALSTETRAADFFDLSAQLWIRLGEPEEIPSTAYEISTDEIVVVSHPENPILSLTLADIRALFSGEIRNWSQLGGEDVPVQVWIFDTGEDIRQIFDATVMHQQSISSQARLAVNSRAMVAGIGTETGAIGVLPRSLVSKDIQVVSIKDLSTSISIPVLAIPSNTGQTTSSFIACLQNK